MPVDVEAAKDRLRAWIAAGETAENKHGYHAAGRDPIEHDISLVLAVLDRMEAQDDCPVCGIAEGDCECTDEDLVGVLWPSPKVASDTGAGLLREAFAAGIAASECEGGGRLSDALIDEMFAEFLAVSPTDATDGATGGGEVMKPWRGGYTAPTDWDSAKPVRHRSGMQRTVKAIEGGAAWLHDGSDSDIIAYTATTPGGDLLEQAARECRNIANNSMLVLDGHDARVRHEGIVAGAQACERAVLALKPAGDGGEA